MPISEMNMKQLVDFLERDDITESQRNEAEARLEMLSTRDFTPNPANKRNPTPKPRPTMEERGFTTSALGGKIHRGRQAEFPRKSAVDQKDPNAPAIYNLSRAEIANVLHRNKYAKRRKELLKRPRLPKINEGARKVDHKAA